MQRGDGAARKAKLTVIVIFNDGAAGVLRPAQQRLPAGNGGNESGGVLVIGGNMQSPGAGGGQRRRVDALSVQRNGDTGSAAGPIDLTDFGVAGVFHGKGRIPAQKLGQQQVEILGAGADNDLGRRDCHTLEVPQFIGNGLPQSGKSLMGNRGQQSLRRLGEHLPGELCPCGNGEACGIHPVAAQIQPRLRRLRRLRLQGNSGGRLLGGGQGSLHGGDEKAPLGPRLQIALCLQLAVRPLHGDDGDPQMFRQRPLGGQPGPGRQRAAENI